ncbi:MAG TPA: preprotein translocase subunit SecE [Micrococcales bacterium]|uniref:Protein translocase subunit SecE n=1 Tax=Miniimonas arenae TaxID=676201 RepID=A0A5C5BAL2_9MICO|nr:MULTISPECIES: preprotein translocase subunit SecE [Miniimonas]TNU73554.1 preprotein translocase subunit SecE [Miniimonas arenae]HCX85150.1 preprotein translocase subunit SecE [Micrococcales bacterium]
MSESSTAEANRPGKSSKEQQPGLFARIALFVRQVVAELRKVVTPTRSELVNYTIVVLVFVLLVMAFVFVLDFGIGKLVMWVFGTPSA